MRFIEGVDEIASMLASISGQRSDLLDRIPKWLVGGIQQVAQMVGSTGCQGRGSVRLKPGVSAYKLTESLQLNSPNDFTGFHTVQIIGGGPIAVSSAEKIVQNLGANPLPNTPAEIAQWGDEFLIYPFSGVELEVIILYWKEVKVDQNGDIPLPESLHMPSVLMGLHYGNIALKDYKAAASVMSTVMGLLGTQKMRPYQSKEGRRGGFTMSEGRYA